MPNTNETEVENDNNTAEEITNVLESSDEDFADLSLEQLEAMVDIDEEEDSVKDDDSNSDTSSDTGDTDNSIENTESIEDEETPGGKEEGTESDEEEEEEIDYKAQIAELMAPFRANNKDMQIDSIEDARKLMQMGANYNKKMAGLKPNLKIMKMLENNDLLDEEKLSFLIDVNKKDPEAIAKLLKDSNIDPLEIDLEEETKYKVNNTYTVDDKEVELDGILEDIQDTASFKQTIDIISNKWDDRSKKMLLEQPEGIRFINDHVQNGIYDRISAVVEQERMLGRLTGMSDLEAYKEVGDAINAQGGFDEPIESDIAKTEVPTTKKGADPKLKSKRKAASSTKSSANTGNKVQFNPLSMSDEEFDKVSSDQFI